MIGGLKQTTSRLAIAAAAGLFMGGIALTPAQAADLGGDCCADLEERVAELEATTVRKGNRKVSVTLYGQVNRAILHWDDGEDSDIYFVDVENSSTRFGIRGSASISPGRTAGFRIEADWFIRDNSSLVSNCDSSSRNAARTQCMAEPHTFGNSGTELTDMRWAEVWIQDERLGKVSLGQGDMASNDMAHVDLSGTSVAMYAGMNDVGGSFEFRSSGGRFTTVSVSATYSDYDGLSRSTRIRYDTPSIGGFVFSTSYGADDKFDGAVRYSKEWNSVRCAGVFAVSHNTEEKNEDTWLTGGTASCIHTPSGLNLTLGYIEEDASGQTFDGTWEFIKVGISRRWNSHGKTNIAFQYARNEDTRVAGDDTDSYGVAIVQNIDSAALELYAAWTVREYSDPTATSYEDINLLLAGARMKF